MSKQSVVYPHGADPNTGICKHDGEDWPCSYVRERFNLPVVSRAEIERRVAIGKSTRRKERHK